MFSPAEILAELGKLDPETTHPQYLGYCLHGIYDQFFLESPTVNPRRWAYFLALVAPHFPNFSQDELEFAFLHFRAR